MRYANTIERARPLVRKAARVLDKLKPGWWKVGRFSLKRLNIGSCTNCVLGQVFKGDAKKDDWIDGFAAIDHVAELKQFDGTGVFTNDAAEEVWQATVERRRKNARKAA